jgi:hypothetical protein
VPCWGRHWTTLDEQRGGCHSLRPGAVKARVSTATADGQAVYRHFAPRPSQGIEPGIDSASGLFHEGGGLAKRCVVTGPGREGLGKRLHDPNMRTLIFQQVRGSSSGGRFCAGSAARDVTNGHAVCERSGTEVTNGSPCWNVGLIPAYTGQSIEAPAARAPVCRPPGGGGATSCLRQTTARSPSSTP